MHRMHGLLSEYYPFINNHIYSHTRFSFVKKNVKFNKQLFSLCIKMIIHSEYFQKYLETIF